MNGIRLSEKYAAFTTEKPFDFTKRSTIGCGGFAPVAFYPKTAEECITLVGYLRTDGFPYQVLGNLSNVLPKSGESDGVVISTKSLKGISFSNGVFVEAGVTSGALLSACKKRGLSGAEFLVGIPCTVGGALYMNAGVAGAYIGELVESVTVIREGELTVLPRSACEYAYKHSAFMQNNDFILGAKLALEEADEASVLVKLKAYADRRKHLPKGKSMGCVFKNPPNAVAGRLIEGAGLKGLRIGGAVVSEMHANFIVNDKGATSEHIQALIAVVKNAVFAQYNVRLEEEIRYLE
ncbi:MAG: UDP-N-acetylmuramate dehydrogenase [Clostridia bacterium]|nr:UDP-N-acetylmuramate dehydrogenase [Clostridia bacterium]